MTESNMSGEKAEESKTTVPDEFPLDRLLIDDFERCAIEWQPPAAVIEHAVKTALTDVPVMTRRWASDDAVRSVTMDVWTVVDDETAQTVLTHIRERFPLTVSVQDNDAGRMTVEVTFRNEGNDR